ncbi:hypothetical protein GH714_003815 [Hevea brasiliensis]|uniref:Uncharacterized protein n=1 Tax=Hevea brasiliensis TaxID=3981 RepID=A0A6A6KQ12_HEVBR|nr:hypothetical protein GH714_003815 [Hevea brasiliensis]
MDSLESSLAKVIALPRNDRSKKVEFRDDQNLSTPLDRSTGDAINPIVTFKDKLLEGSVGNPDYEMDSSEDDGDSVKISDKNFSIDLPKAILRIILSQNAREQLVKPRQKAVVVRLMGKTIGYRGLCSKIQILLKQEGDYKVIDLCNDVEDRVQIVEYEGLQNECFTCGGYDHSKEFCHVHALVVSREGASKNDSGAGGAKIQENTSTEEENFRKWMLAPLRVRRNMSGMMRDSKEKS